MTLNQARQILTLKSKANNLVRSTEELCICVDNMVAEGKLSTDSDLYAIASVLVESSCDVVCALNSFVGDEETQMVERFDRKINSPKSVRRQTKSKNSSKLALEKAVNEVLQCF